MAGGEVIEELRKQKAALIGLYIIFHKDKGIRKKIRQIDKLIRKEVNNERTM